MTQSVEPTAQELRRFRSLAWDIAYLRRACGLVVAPFHDGFRIDNQVVTADELAERARREREAASSEPPPPSAPPPQDREDLRGDPPIWSARPIVQLERARLGDEAYRRAALSECAQACSVLIDSFPWHERPALVETICTRLQEHESE